MLSRLLGPYRVLEKIGEGGMGEVYKALDARLDRTVAIKILPPDLRTDRERRARLEREARTIAGLNHPHICTLHDVGEHDGSTFLVMELLAGESLADRLRKGPLPLEQALTVAGEIAEALAAAHRKGVVHRDLKPGNVMLTRAGAKILDFGLAKLAGDGGEPVAAEVASAPTQSTPLTAQGAILGTLQYMAPEQLEAKPADARTDVWALGAILYEMVTGTRAFKGRSAASLMAAILHHQPPPMASVQPLVSPSLERLVARCLAKDPDDRWDSTHDLAAELRWLREGRTERSLPAPVGRPGVHSRIPSWVGLLVVATALAGTGVNSWLSRGSSAAPGVSIVRTSIDLGPAEELNSGVAGGASGRSFTPGGSQTAFAWTPDGRGLVFVGRRARTQQLYVRPLERDEARPLAGTEGAQVPAVSPDGRWVAFFAGGKVKKVPLRGGPVLEVVPNLGELPNGLAWDAGGSLYFAHPDGRIWKASAEGVLSPVTTHVSTEYRHVHPCLLPGEHALLYTARNRDWSWGEDDLVVAQTLPAGVRKTLLVGAVDARYVPTGHLVFLRRGTLFAVAFDPVRLEVKGTPVALLDGVVQALTGESNLDATGAGQFAVAPTGTLAWLRGPVVPFESGELVSVDRGGRVSALSTPRNTYYSTVRLAPGGRQLAVTVLGLTEVGLWICDLARGALTPVLRRGEVYAANWTPDGERLVFSWLEAGRPSLAWQRVDGITPEPLGSAEHFDTFSSWTRNGRQFVGVRYLADNWDLTVVKVENGRATAQALTTTPANELSPEVSPDGRWLAFESDDSGRHEVYVQPFPGPGPRTRVSIEGGLSPAWASNGRELFFAGLRAASGKHRMMVVSFSPGTPARVGAARPLFEFDNGRLGFVGEPVRHYDVAPDGQRFFVVRRQAPPPTVPVTHLNIVQNWLEELKAKVQPAR